MAQRTDLPLSDDSTTRLVPWIVGVMAYLAALALSAALTLSNVARELSEGLEGSLTVQVPAAETDASQTTDAKIVAAVRVLLKTDGVDSPPIPLAEIGKMLEPWLGSAAATTDLPLPRVIDVRLKPDATIDFTTLATSGERGAVPRLRPTRNGGNAAPALPIYRGRGHRRYTADFCRSARRDRLDDTQRFGRTS